MNPTWDSGKYPVLSRGVDWGPVHARLVPVVPEEDSPMVGNVTIVPFVGEACVLIRLTSGRWECVGGTLEPGERYMDALRREVREEIGSELVTFRPFGQFECFSSSPQPYRPHLPHPRFVRCVGYGTVNPVGEPTNPPDGEQVAEVAIVSISEAVRRFRADGREELAELYLLADHIKRLDRGER